MRAKTINEASYWDETSQNFQEYQDYWNELVPQMGEAETLQGEILRCISRIAYDYYNNGFGNDKEDEAMFLEKHSAKFKPHMANPNHWEDFFHHYSNIGFGDFDKMNPRDSRHLWDEDEDEEEDYDTPDEYIKREGWNVDSHIDDILDGVVKYIRLTKDKLVPLK